MNDFNPISKSKHPILYTFYKRTKYEIRFKKIFWPQNYTTTIISPPSVDRRTHHPPTTFLSLSVRANGPRRSSATREAPNYRENWVKDHPLLLSIPRTYRARGTDLSRARRADWSIPENSREREGREEAYLITRARARALFVKFRASGCGDDCQRMWARIVGRLCLRSVQCIVLDSACISVLTLPSWAESEEELNNYKDDLLWYSNQFSLRININAVAFSYLSWTDNWENTNFRSVLKISFILYLENIYWDPISKFNLSRIPVAVFGIGLESSILDSRAKYSKFEFHETSAPRYFEKFQ